ncbi:MAG: adenylate/guanylate cyclase domain-containing protein [Cytophagales bacterium]
MLQALFNDNTNPVFCYFSENNQYEDLNSRFENNFIDSTNVEDIAIEKFVSILFVDIADFTHLSDKNSASSIAKMLKEYYEIAGRIIQKYNGSIIDYYGDGFLAIFGLNGSKKHPKNLIKAAMELQEAVKAFKPRVKELCHEDFNIRIGGHSGKIIWERIGIPGMHKHAAIGDSVNFASRIEQANKYLKTKFLVSENLYQQIQKDVVVQKSFNIRAKGKEGMHRVYSLI